MRILIVDDDEVDRALINRTLRNSSLNLTIIEALSVDEGLRACKEQCFDMILLDYRMPQRDGIEMVIELRNQPSGQSVAVVMMSASEDEALALECIRAGAQDFITKAEVSEVRLRRALLHATTRFELEKELHETYGRLKSLAETDALTGLSNRYLFDESLKQSIVRSQRNNQRQALLLFDLDNFKIVNDSFGHDDGDRLLQKVAKRTASCLRGSEVLCRLGGDEFAINLTNLCHVDNASTVAHRILRVLEKPFELSSGSISVSASIGIALYPENGSCSEDLFKFADIAMYRAKRLGRNQACFFEPKMQEAFHERLKFEAELQDAIHKKQMRLYYQPVINPTDGSTIGFEALIRWHIEGSVRMPDQFIPIAEETKQIREIGNWIIEEAVSTLAAWNDQQKKYSKPALSMAINISPVQLSNMDLVKFLQATLSQHKIPPHLIDIELTETALLKDTKITREVIYGLHRLGCRLSLDDFGTGYSSIAHLRNYPISVVKIDRSLMPSDAHDKKNVALIQGLVFMANVLELDVVAEGVENQAHELLCQKFKISKAQGYYYSKPLPQQEIEREYLTMLCEGSVPAMLGVKK